MSSAAPVVVVAPGAGERLDGAGKYIVDFIIGSAR